MSESATHQFRMRRLQLFNWGTFSGLHDIPIAEAGLLVLGPSGAGKSTLLDALSALLVPPKWIDFNAAARETDRTGKDRSFLSYVRGAWGEQQDTASGDFVKRYLRPRTTWSALAVTFQNARGQSVVLVRILWVRGATTANTDVQHRYVILERVFDLKELQGGFDLDVRKLKQLLPEAFERGEFSGYGERFRRLLGIDSEMALRLLHKTQSAKNLGDLNTLLRDFMLDKPETFDVADRLVNEFAELNAAHQSVVTASEQIQTLLPARDGHDQLQTKLRARTDRKELRLGIDPFRDARRRTLLEEHLASLAVAAEGHDGEIQRRQSVVTQCTTTLRQLHQQHRDLGGDQIEAWQSEQAELESQKETRLRKRAHAQQSCRKLGWVFPESPQGLAQLAQQARQETETWQQQRDGTRDRHIKLASQRAEAETACAAATREVEVLRRNPSNIDSRMQELRAHIARELDLPETSLPFAGELLEVDPRHIEWRGAIERLLRGFAQSLLVDERHYAAVSSYVNNANLGRRLVYFRIGRPEQTAGRPLAPNSLIHKLQIKPGDHAAWLQAELRQRFDYACVDSLAAFRATERAVTREGQIRHGKTRHEKDDRFALDDPRNRVLGFDNEEKLRHFTKQAHDAADEIRRLADQIKSLTDDERQRDERALACQALANLQWQEIDIAAVLLRMHSLDGLITVARSSNTTLEAIATQIEAAKERLDGAESALRDERVKRDGVAEESRKASAKLEALRSRPTPVLTPHQQSGLEQRFAALPPATLDNLDPLILEIERALRTEVEALSAEIGALEKSIERSFTEFKTRWPMEAGDLDSTLASAPDFLAKLHRLEADGLPAYQERFFVLLQNQSHQNLAALAKHLGYARDTIVERMEQVNSSLSHAEFNLGTHLEIEVTDRQQPDVRTFKQEIQAALEHAWSDDRANAESRFAALRDLVARLASQEPEQRRWREAVLDVRQHVDFLAREVDAEGTAIEVYRSGAGKSGGQRQKLATTCLAAALRYQLGGESTAPPPYAAVVLDEAFDKADHEFTTLAMKIFVQFGFQMIVATPLKSVMTLEPFIGGACFIDIRDRSQSAVLLIEYDAERRRLKLPRPLQPETLVEAS